MKICLDNNMSKKTATTGKSTKQEIVYKTHPLIIFLVIGLCGVVLFAVLGLEYQLEQLALSDQIYIRGLTHTTTASTQPTVTPKVNKMGY